MSKELHHAAVTAVRVTTERGIKRESGGPIGNMYLILVGKL
jgi:hypothetical protein